MPQPPARKPAWVIRAIADPREVVSALIPQPKDHDPAGKRLENSKWARALGGGAQLDYGIGEPDRASALPPLNCPLSDIEIDPRVQEKLPLAHHVRCLQRGDYDRGFTKLKSVGPVMEAAWNERCSYLHKRSDMHIILVITKLLPNADELVVCAGTLVVERRFAHNMSTVGHVQDLEVAEGHSGRHLGLRMLEALDMVAATLGCYKTIVRTHAKDEAFFAQNGENWLLLEANLPHVPRES